MSVMQLNELSCTDSRPKIDVENAVYDPWWWAPLAWMQRLGQFSLVDGEYYIRPCSVCDPEDSIVSAC